MLKLAIAAEQSFRRIKGLDSLAAVIRGVQFVHGVIEQDQQRQPLPDNLPVHSYSL